VTFPKWRNYVVDPGGQTYTVSNNATGGGQPNTVKVIHSTAYADFSTNSGSPANSSACASLAAQISSDYFAWLTESYDHTFQSLQDWTLTGYDDHVLWSFGSVKDGNYQASTRVQTRAFNFGDEEQLQQFASKPIYQFPLLVKTTTTHGSGASQTVNVWGGTAGSETVTSPLISFTAVNRTSVSIASGKFCRAFWAQLQFGTDSYGAIYIEPLEC
jgi:hypothetical protein